MLLLGVLLAIRLAGLMGSPYGLHGDEAQYWAWSRNPDWGYFSKPPMIAWVIWATTSVFGNAEWAVRLASPFLHTATAGMVFLTGRKLFDGRVGFWACATYALMPAVWLSSFIISTDATLLLCWAVALHAWACLRERGSWGRAVQLGLALGLGLMSKYAMAFFVPVLVLATLFDKPTRRALLGPKGFLAAAIAAAWLTPNLLWNAANDFATISHTAENANLQQDLFNPSEVLKFWVDQFGVFGIISFPILLLALIAAMRGRLPAPAKWLVGFAALPLLAITVEALLSRANANWAVTAYGAGPILGAVWALQSNRRRAWLKWGLIVQTAVVLTVGVCALVPAWRDSLGLGNSVKRMVAWPETEQALSDIYLAGFEGQAFAGLATDNRLVHYDLDYYGIQDTAKLYMWALNDTPAHHADLTRPLPAGDGPYLIVNYYDRYAEFFREDFDHVEILPTLEIPTAGGKKRQLKLWVGYGYTPTTREDR